jgi:hypothetical protein
MSDIVRALAPVVEALEVVGRRYRVGGSVASSALGVPRSTLDVDIVCDLSDVDANGATSSAFFSSSAKRSTAPTWAEKLGLEDPLARAIREARI